MESHLEHTHGRHYDNNDALTAAAHQTGHDHNEDEHHGEKKSVMKKVKEKAKKLKDTITKHGHGHGHGGRDHDDYHNHHHDHEETVEDPEVHGARMYDSARVTLGGPDAILAQPKGNLERPSVMAEDRYTVPVAIHGAPPLVSTGPYGTNLSEPSGHAHGQPQAYGNEVNPDNSRGKIGKPTGVEKDSVGPNPTKVNSPTDQLYGTIHVSEPVGNRGQGEDVNQGGLRGKIGKSTGMLADPHAPKDPSRLGSDPSNYETKVNNPTHTGGKEAELSQIQHSLNKLEIHDNQLGSDPKRYDPNHPENLPHETLTGKITSSASAIADKAAVAKDVIASKLGYSGQNPTTGSHETVKNQSGSATDYAHKITDKVTGTLAPVYEKVKDAGSSVISKVQGTGTEQTQVQRESESVMVEKGKGDEDKGVSVEYLVETLRPGEEDKALSKAITETIHRGKHEESEKKSGEDVAMGRVTESEEVRRRLGSDDDHHGEQEDSNTVTANKNVTERLSDAMGSWFGGKGNAPQGTLGTSYVTDEGLSTNPSGDQKSGSD